MRRLGFTVLALGLAAGAWTLRNRDRQPVAIAGGIGPISNFFRNAAELESFRALLGDARIKSDLETMCGTFVHLALILNSTIPAAAGESCLASLPGEGNLRHLHRLVFVESTEPISRALVLDYSTCKRGDGSHEVSMERQFFSSVFARLGEPVFADTMGLAVFAKAFQTDGVVSRMQLTLAARQIAFVRAVRAAQGEAGGRVPFVFETWTQEEGNEAALAWSADAYYDLADQTVEFER